MKRFLLIAAGTVGGLGAVLSVTPPQLGATDLGLGLDMGTLTTSETPAQTETSAPAPTVNSVNGTFTGPVVDVSYGNVQVQITVVNGVITDAQAIKAPSGKNDRYTNMAVPILKQQTLAAQSANIKGASGASYTSYGWFTSLQGALADAGL